MHSGLRKLLIALLLLCCLPATAGSKVTVYSQMNIYPYFFGDGDVNDGIIPEVLNDMLGDKFGLDYFTLSCDTCDEKFNPDIICCPDDEPMPAGYRKYSLPLQIDYVVCFRKNQPIESFFSLNDKHVIVVKNDYPFEALYRHRTSHILNVATADEALRTLSEGYDDCAVLPLSAVSKILSSGRFANIDILSTPFIVKPLAFGVRQSDNKFDSIVNVSLENVLDNGRFEAISKHWLQNSRVVSGHISCWTYALVALLIVTVILMYLWIKTLYAEVEDSTKERIRSYIHNPTSPLIFPANNELMQKVLHSAPFWFIVSDRDGHIMKTSRAFLRSVAEIDTLPVNAKLTDIIESSTVDKLTEFDSLIYQGHTNSVIQTIYFKSKCFEGDRWIVKHPFKYDDSSEIFIVTAIIPPVFDTNLFYNTLNTEAFIKAIIDASPDLVYLKSVDGTYMQANKAFCNYYNLTENKITGNTDIELFGGKVSDSHVESDAEVLQSGNVWSEQTWHTDSQGTDHKFENLKMPLFNLENKVFGLVGISHEITDIDRLSKQVKTANDRYSESNRMKTSFLANLGHDIRVPVSKIVEYADLLVDVDLTYDQRVEIIENIQTNGNMLVDLVNDMVDYSNIDAGHIKIKYSDFNLNSIVADVYNIANSKKMQLNKDNLYISLLIDTIEDDVMIHSDSFRLKQILKNMLITIIRFADTDSVYFGYRTTNDKVYFFINTDKGDVSKDELLTYDEVSHGNKIDIAQIEESYGISIIIAQSIINMMGGNLWIDGLNSGHPNFIFYIPYEHERELSPIMYDSKNDEYKIPNWAGHTILIAEDEELNFILLQGMMMRTKVKVVRAKNGIEAVQMYKDNPDIEVVLMDVRMPEMNGLDASELILNYDNKADIIAQTAYAIPEVTERCVRIGIHKLLEKPIDQGKLFAECDKYMKYNKNSNDDELMD